MLNLVLGMLNLVLDVMPVAENLLDKKEAWADRRIIAMDQAGADVRELLRGQLSGRKPDDMGLNMRTGNLFDSLQNKTEIVDGGIESTIFNTDAKYWWYHQVGAGNNPKRLMMDEQFASDGMEVYYKQLGLAMEEAF